MTIEVHDSHFGVSFQMHLFDGAKNSLALAAALQTILEAKSTKTLASEAKREDETNQDLIKAIKLVWEKLGRTFPPNILAYMNFVQTSHKKDLSKLIKDIEAFLGLEIAKEKHHQSGSHSHTAGGKSK